MGVEKLCEKQQGVKLRAFFLLGTHLTMLNQTRMNSLVRDVDSIVYSSQTTKMARLYFPDSTEEINL